MNKIQRELNLGNESIGIFSRKFGRFITKLPIKLNLSTKIPRIFGLKNSKEWTKSENELMEYLYMSCNAKGAVANYSHARVAETFGMPIESYMRAFRKLESKEEIKYIDSQNIVYIKDYQRIMQSNPTDQKNLPIEEQRNRGGYITVSLKGIVSGINRHLKPREKRILLYVQARIGRSKSLIISQKQLCEYFKLMPCELNDYLENLFKHEALQGEFDVEKKQWQLRLGENVAELKEDALTFLVDWAKHAREIAADKLASIIQEVYKMLVLYQFTTRFKLIGAMQIINLVSDYGLSAIDNVLFRLRTKFDSGGFWPDDVIAYITAAAKNNKMEL